MPSKPWVTFHPPDPARVYLALLSELPLKRFRDVGRVFLHTWRIQGQLKETPVLLGYSLKAHLLSKKFWTLSVWEGEAPLQRFVVQRPHAGAMTALHGMMERTHFARWSIRGCEYPPRWREALKRGLAV